MITTSQKARLCEMAQHLKPIFEIGKNGIGGKEIIDISIALDSQNLLKYLFLTMRQTTPKHF